MDIIQERCLNLVDDNDIIVLVTEPQILLNLKSVLAGLKMYFG